MQAQMINYLNKLKMLNEDYQSYIITGIVILILIIIIVCVIYFRRLMTIECNFMNDIYSAVNGNIKPISANDPDCSGNLCDYYIQTAYNACSGGAIVNDYVDVCNLKAIIKQGVRCLDFEIYSIDNNPVVSTSTTQGDFFVKETFNSVNFSDVMTTIQDYAFSGGTCPNPTDPLIIHLRFQSNNQQMFTNLAKIFMSYDTIMLGKQYSYENSGTNLGSLPLLSFQNKVILIADKSNPAFLENTNLLEYINLCSNSIFMRLSNYYNVKNNPDIGELTEYNKKCMSIVLPDIGANPSNPSGILCRASGCQMVAMRYQLVDSLLMENTAFFNSTNYAFALKPIELRYTVITIPDPTPQNPDYSYATRNVSSDYYNFNM